MTASSKVVEFDRLVKALNKIIFGSENETVTLDGIVKPTISNFLKGYTASKADLAYVNSKFASIDTLNTALSQLNTAASKYYSTLAEANQQIAYMGVNELVYVGNYGGAEGLYYKANEGSTNLTKSNYDPLTKAKAYADANKLDISKIQFEYVNGNKVGPKTKKVINTGYYVSGNIQTGPNVDCLVIPVKAGEVLYVKNSANNFSANNNYTFLAEEIGSISPQPGLVSTNNQYTDISSSIVYRRVVVPSNAKFMVMNCRFNTVNYDWAVHADKFSTSYAAGKETLYSVNDIPTISSEIVEKIIDSKVEIHTEYVGGNEVGNATTIGNMFIDNLTKLIKSASGDVISLPVVEGDTLYFFNTAQKYSSPANFAFYPNDPMLDTAQAYIPATFNTGIDVNGKTYRFVVVPVGARYFVLNSRFVVSGSNVFYTWAIHKNILRTTYDLGVNQVTKLNNIPLKADQDEKNYLSSRFEGEKIYAFGDSITQGTEGGYVGYIASELKCIVNNYGMSGAGAQRLVDIVTAGAGLPKRDSSTSGTVFPAKDFTACKAVTIQIGTNGYNVGSVADIPTGNVSDYADPLEYWALFPASSFHANIALCIEYIRSINPECEIYLISAPHTYRSSDSYAPTRMMQMFSFIKEIGEYYSLPVIPAIIESGVSFKYMKAELNRYSYDGTHFNALGNKLWGKYIARKILSGG